MPLKTNHKTHRQTGLYYYGARYYNPRTSMWLSVDPLAELAPAAARLASAYRAGAGVKRTLLNHVKVKKCFLFILFSILFSCNSSNENIKEIADSKKENNIPFYEINLSDTIEINTPTEFEIKLIYPNQKILSDYFSILILSDSTKVTFENLLERKDHPFEIEELDVNYWKAKRTFTKKRRLYTQRWDLCQRAIDYRYRRGFYWYFRRKDDNSH